jgi:hypothetical protein
MGPVKNVEETQETVRNSDAAKVEGKKTTVLRRLAFDRAGHLSSATLPGAKRVLTAQAGARFDYKITVAGTDGADEDLVESATYNAQGLQEKVLSLDSTGNTLGFEHYQYSPEGYLTQLHVEDINSGVVADLRSDDTGSNPRTLSASCGKAGPYTFLLVRGQGSERTLVPQYPDELSACNEALRDAEYDGSFEIHFHFEGATLSGTEQTFSADPKDPKGTQPIITEYKDLDRFGNWTNKYTRYARDPKDSPLMKNAHREITYY